MRGAAGQAVGRWMAIRVLNSTMMKGQKAFHPVPERNAASRPRWEARIAASWPGLDAGDDALDPTP